MQTRKCHADADADADADAYADANRIRTTNNMFSSPSVGDIIKSLSLVLQCQLQEVYIIHRRGNLMKQEKKTARRVLSLWLYLKTIDFNE